MKTFVLLVAIFTLLSYSNADDLAECKNTAYTFDCAGYKPHYEKRSDDRCDFFCAFGDQLLTCEEVHPAPNTTAYQNAACQEKNVSYDCNGTGGEGDPYWFETGCRFSCVVEGDMLFTCEQIWPLI